jgi:iron complex transport system substrate-binding protein
MKNFAFFFVFSALILACKQDTKLGTIENSEKNFEFITNLELKETAERIEIHSGGEIVAFPTEELPLKSAMIVPTSVIAYMNELELIDKISGISQIDFIYHSQIQELFRQKKIIEIGNFNELFVESILLQKPDVLFSTSSPSLAKYHEQLKNQGIKIIYIDEYEELDPLAKAEYIKVIGKLFGQEEKANQIFEEIKSHYREIKTKIAESKPKLPKVLVNQIYSDVWYLPSGNSFQAKLVSDAGGFYPWKDLEGKTTLNLSFESVFEKAEDADVWINAGDFPSKEALIASYPHYEWFKAYQNNQVYNWYNRTSPTGGNDYFETGTARPDYVLEDLAAIFHPELFPEHPLKFYKKLD